MRYIPDHARGPAIQITGKRAQRGDITCGRGALCGTVFLSGQRRSKGRAGAPIIKDAETGLIGQKKLTEEAQIKDVVSGSTVVGVVGKQKDLYSKQAEGFLRDAEQKGAKIIVDTWNLRQSTDGALADPAGLSDVSVKAVVDKLKAGIGA